MGTGSFDHTLLCSTLCSQKRKRVSISANPLNSMARQERFELSADGLEEPESFTKNQLLQCVASVVSFAVFMLFKPFTERILCTTYSYNAEQIECCFVN